jgi:two-component system LytT family response regulator
VKLIVGIVEDSLENIQTLRYLLSEISGDIEILGTARTLDEARHLLRQPLDLAFLDIQLREGTIFEILEEMQQTSQSIPSLIFVTAHGSFDYAAKALRFAALDFLTKPLATDELRKALDRFKTVNVQRHSQPEQVRFMLELLRGNMQAPKSIGIILIKGVIEFVDLAEILYFEADENTCKVFQYTAPSLHSTKHLGYYIDLLSGNSEFAQISKSCLVNVAHVKRYDHRSKELALKTGQVLVASHRFSKVLKERLMEMRGGSASLWDRFLGR